MGSSAQADAQPPTIFIDEFDASGFKRALKCHPCLIRGSSFALTFHPFDGGERKPRACG